MSEAFEKMLYDLQKEHHRVNQTDIKELRNEVKTLVVAFHSHTAVGKKVATIWGLIGSAIFTLIILCIKTFIAQ